MKKVYDILIKNFYISYTMFTGKNTVCITLQAKENSFHFDVRLKKRQYKKLIDYIVKYGNLI